MHCWGVVEAVRLVVESDSSVDLKMAVEVAGSLKGSPQPRLVQAVVGSRVCGRDPVVRRPSFHNRSSRPLVLLRPCWRASAGICLDTEHLRGQGRIPSYVENMHWTVFLPAYDHNTGPRSIIWHEDRAVYLNQLVMQMLQRHLGVLITMLAHSFTVAAR